MRSALPLRPQVDWGAIDRGGLRGINEGFAQPSIGSIGKVSASASDTRDRGTKPSPGHARRPGGSCPPTPLP
eukprot:12406166-Alexandrium_andersonii.AAC.1